MDLKKIQELIKFVSKSGVSEVQLEEKDFKITIKTELSKEDGIKGSYPQYLPHYIPMPQGQGMPVQSPDLQPPAQPAQTEKPAQENQTEAADEVTDNHKVIKAPMIGTFYLRPGPDKDPFIKIGDTVKKGDTVCIIEAMKLFNEIETEFSGKIVKLLAKDASPVEYDQPLFLVEPE